MFFDLGLKLGSSVGIFVGCLEKESLLGRSLEQGSSLEEGVLGKVLGLRGSLRG